MADVVSKDVLVDTLAYSVALPLPAVPKDYQMAPELVRHKVVALDCRSTVLFALGMNMVVLLDIHNELFLLEQAIAEEVDKIHIQALLGSQECSFRTAMLL